MKVLDAQGSGTTSGVIAGIDWAAKQVAAKKSKKRKSVANMSLGGGASAALDKAVRGISFYKIRGDCFWAYFRSCCRKLR